MNFRSLFLLSICSLFAPSTFAVGVYTFAELSDPHYRETLSDECREEIKSDLIRIRDLGTGKILVNFIQGSKVTSAMNMRLERIFDTRQYPHLPIPQHRQIFYYGKYLGLNEKIQLMAFLQAGYITLTVHHMTRPFPLMDWDILGSKTFEIRY